MKTIYRRRSPLVLAATYAVIALLLVTTIGCSSSPSKTGAEAKTLKIGSSIPLTGNLAKEGNLTKQGYELWRDTVNEKGGIKVGKDSYKIEVVFYDDKSDANTAGKLTEKIINEDKAQFMLSPYSSGLTQATSSICEKYKMVNIAPSANAVQIYNRGYKYIFGVMPPGPLGASVVLSMAKEDNLDVKKVAILTPDDLYPLSAAEGARAKAKELGMELVMFEKYPKGNNDFSSIVSSIKAKSPDVLVLTGYFEEIVMLIRQLKELKVNVKMIADKGAPLIPDFVNTLGKDAEGVYGQMEWTVDSGWKGPVFGSSMDYGKMFKDKFGADATYYSASGSAAGLVLQLALEKAGKVDPEAVRQALTQLDVETFWMPVKFGKWQDMDQINIAGANLAVQIQNGKPVTVYPKKVRAKQPVFPAPAWQ